MTSGSGIIRELEALEQLRRLTAEYAHGLDGRDLELFAGVWAEDAEWQPSPSFPWCRGVPEIRAMAERIFEGVERTHHLVTNHLFDVDIEKGTATGVSHMLSENLGRDGNFSRACATHRDRYVLSGGRWLITHRSCDLYELG